MTARARNSGTFGASSSANPALMRPVPLSMTMGLFVRKEGTWRAVPNKEAREGEKEGERQKQDIVVVSVIST